MASKTGALSPAVEDYLKAVYVLETRLERPASTSALAERLGVTPASASAMAKKLAELRLVAHEPYRGVRLTARGKAAALEVLRHHRLLELYLAEHLGMPWDEVHAEAELLEHVISEEIEELIAVKLGHPRRDPHGDPIPLRDGRIDEAPTHSLKDLAPGTTGIFIRISDSEPALLRYLAEKGIAPGDELEVVEQEPFGGPLTVRFGDDVQALGARVAGAMRVEVR